MQLHDDDIKKALKIRRILAGATSDDTVREALNGLVDLVMNHRHVETEDIDIRTAGIYNDDGLPDPSEPPA